MLVDVISLKNYTSFNSIIAHKIGLNNAIYLNVLLDLQSFANDYNECDADGYFEVDRDLVMKKTTFTKSQQLKLEADLSDIYFISIKNDRVKVNEEVIFGLSANMSEDVTRCIKKITKKSTKKSSTEYALKAVKNKIDLNYSPQVRTALEDWLDSIVQKFNFIRAQTLYDAQEFLNPIIAVDETRAINIIRACEANGYRQMNYGMSTIDSLNKIKTSQNVITNVTHTATLSDDYF